MSFLIIAMRCRLTGKSSDLGGGRDSDWNFFFIKRNKIFWRFFVILTSLNNTLICKNSKQEQPLLIGLLNLWEHLK